MSEDPRPEPRRSGWARRTRRALLVLGILAVALVLGLHLPPVERSLINYALAKLRSPIGADITFQSIHYNLFSRAISIDGLKVGEPGQPPLVSASHVTVRYPWASYRGSLDGLDVTLDGADITLIHEGGRWRTVPARWLAPSTSPGAPRPLPAFAALRLHDVGVHYEDRDAKFVAQTKGLIVDLLPTGSGQLGDLAGALGSTATTELSWYPRNTLLKILGGRARYAPQGAGVEDFRVEAPEGTINTNVAFSFHGTDRLQLRAHGDLRGEALHVWAPMLDTLRGPLGVNFQLPASNGAPAFADVAVTGKGLSWQKVQIDDLAAKGALETGGITLSTLRVAVGGGSAEGNGRLAWQDAGQSRALLKWRDIDAGRIWRILLASSPGALYVAPGSIVSGRFEGNWTSWHAAALDAKLETVWRRRGAGLERGERLSLDGKVDARFQRGPWTINVDARADGALGMRGTIKTRGSLADYSDWPISGTLALSGPVAPVALDAFRLAGLDARPEFSDATGQIGGTAELSRTFGTIQAALALHGELTWPNQPRVGVDVDATVTPSAVTVTSFRATSGEATAQASTRLDLDRHTIDGQFAGSRIAVESWTRRFGLEAPATGLVDVTGTVTGPLKQPLVEASVQGGPLLVSGQAVSSVAGHVQYTNGVLNLNDVTVTSARGGQLAGNASWTIEGGAVSAAVTATALAVDADVPGLSTSADRATGRISTRVDGDIHVDGTTKSPIVTADLHAPSLLLDESDYGAAKAKVTTAGSRVHADVRADGLGAHIVGDLDLNGDRDFTAELSVHSPDSPFAARVKGIDVALGAIDLVAHAAGSVQAKELRSADLAVDRLTATVHALPIAVASGARVTWQPDAVDVAGVDVSSAGTHLTASGRLDGQAAHSLQLKLTGKLQDLRPSVATFMPAGTEDMVLDGAFIATVTASGSVKTPVVTGALNLDQATIGDGVKPPVTGIKVEASLDRDRLTLQVAEGHWQGAHAAIAGTVPARFLGVPGASPGGEASLTGHVDDVTIQVLEPFVSTEALKATDFNVRIEYSVAAREPTIESAMADVRVVDAAISSREVGLKQEAPGHLTLKAGVATLASWTIVAPELSTRLTVGGQVKLTGVQTVEAKADGEIDLRSLALVLGGYRPAGRATLSASVNGPLATPQVQGFVTIEHGEMLVRDPRLVFGEVNGTIRFAGDQMTVEGLAGSVNGGSVTASGGMRLPGRGAPHGNVAIKVTGALFDVPHGLRSMVDADFTLSGRPQDSRITLGGTATIVEAAYREQLIVTGGLLSLFQPKPQTFGTTPQRSSGPSQFVINIQVLANDSIALDTSYGRVSFGMNLRVFGPPSNVRLLGQADIAPGGEIFFGGHTYQIQSGRFEFRDPSSIAPDVHLVAQTTIGGYNLTMRVETTDGRTETTLSSDPPLPDDQIASLMVSGTRTSSVAPGDMVTQQLAAALSGEITSAVGRAIGFDSVRIESGSPGDLLFDPSLISADSNPAQRLTFSKKVLPTLEVILSQNLRESGQITYVVSWEVIPRLQLRYVQLDNQDRSYEIRHDISFGGGSAIRPVKRKLPEIVRNVYVAAFGDVGDAEIRKQLRITEGRRFDFYKWQKDRDKLEKLFLTRGYFEARITARREPSSPPPSKGGPPTPVDLGYTIDEGPPTALVVNGIKVPSELRQALISAWTDTPINSVLNEEFSTLLVPWLADQGYLQPTISTKVGLIGRTKTASITVAPGVLYTTREAVYTGNKTVPSKKLDDAVKLSALGARMWTSPSDLQTVITSAYHDRGYLGVRVDISSPVFQGTRAQLPVHITEGPVFIAGAVRVDDPGTPPKGVDLTPPIAVGTILTDQLVRDGQRQLQQRYRSAGYRGTRITPQSTARSDKSTVDLVFKVTRGQQMSLGTLTIAGVEGQERAMVERRVAFTPGQTISLDALNAARDRLYDTDAFRTVAIDMTPRPTADGARPSGVMDTTVTVEALPKYRLQYGFQLFDPYRSPVSPKWGSVDPGVVVDLTRRALFGHGITAGISGRANPSDHVVRAYVSSHRFFGIGAQTNVYVGDEWKREVSDLGLFAEKRTRDFTFDQRMRRKGLQFAYGYNFQKLAIDLTSPVPEGVVPDIVTIKGNLSRLLASVYYDKRDNALDTSHGWFHSTSAEFAPEWLGSTQGYRKYLNQDFYFLPLPGTLVLASAARIELASGSGQFFITSERLRGGGTSTVRGYDDVSLALVTQQDTGRTSLLVWNEEIRFPIFRRFRGATFWDHANFFGNFELPDLTRNRNSVGAGIRFVLPFILFRVDYGYPLIKDPVNNHGRWYFAIGQAF